MYNITYYVIDHIFKLSLKTLHSRLFSISFHSGNSGNQFLPEIPGTIPPGIWTFSDFFLNFNILAGEFREFQRIPPGISGGLIRPQEWPLLFQRDAQFHLKEWLLLFQRDIQSHPEERPLLFQRNSPISPRRAAAPISKGYLISPKRVAAPILKEFPNFTQKSGHSYFKVVLNIMKCPAAPLLMLIFLRAAAVGFIIHKGVMSRAVLLN